MSLATGREEGEEVTDVYEALSNRHRRATLRALRDGSGSLQMDDLAAELADGLERDDDDAGREDRVQKLQVRLQHCHVPKLEATGLVTYDTAAEEVSLTETATESDAVEAGLELAIEER